MGHGGVRRRTVPMFDASRDPDDIAGVHFLRGLAPHLDPTAPLGDDQRLTEQMRMPGRACAGFEGDGRATTANIRFAAP